MFFIFANLMLAGVLLIIGMLTLKMVSYALTCSPIKAVKQWAH